MILDPVPAYVIKTNDTQTSEKVFINVCTDEQVLSPSTLDSSEIEMRVLKGEDWIVPIVVSAGRKSTDKAGSVCSVYDCCMNPAVVLLGIENSGVKVLTVETCLELVEQSHGRLLDRNYRFPRMKSKGDLMQTEFNADTPHKQAQSAPSATELPETSEKQLNSDLLPELARSSDSAGPQKNPVIEVVSGSESVSPFYFHLYRGPYSGEGPRPSHIVEIEGNPESLVMDRSKLSLEGTEPLDLGFVPAKYDAFHNAEDNTTYVMLWRSV